MKTEDYESRIAALEAKLSALESASPHAETPQFNWKSWLEKYGLLVAWVVVIFDPWHL